MDLDITCVAHGDRTVVRIAGEIDAFTAPQLRQHMLGLTRDGHRHLVVDLDGVGFMDSTGLGVLIGVMRRLRDDDGSLRLVCTREQILKILRITGLTGVFPIDASVEAAVAADG